MAFSPAETDNLMTDGNTETGLQALFDSVLAPDAKHPHQVPWSMRKLPDSFFNPPMTGSKSIGHSRDNSLDSTVNGHSDLTTSSLNAVPLQTVHQRAHSSPASFQRSSLDKNSSACHHTKQHSCDLDKSAGNTSLPFGWEAAVSPEGQVYYLNHITRTTTWEDPRKFQDTRTLHTCNTVESTKNTSSVGSDLLGPLPDGWEQSETHDGDIYFINHLIRTTSWFDPRIPMNLQQVSSGELMASPWYTDLVSSSFQVEQQDLRLQLLHMERERLKERQEEIKRQQSLVNGDVNIAISQFVSEFNDHSRQQSSDSALGESLKDWTSTESPIGSSVVASEKFLCTIDNMSLSENQPVQMPVIMNLDYNIEPSVVVTTPLSIQKQF